MATSGDSIAFQQAGSLISMEQMFPLFRLAFRSEGDDYVSIGREDPWDVHVASLRRRYLRRIVTSYIQNRSVGQEFLRHKPKLVLRLHPAVLRVILADVTISVDSQRVKYAREGGKRGDATYSPNGIAFFDPFPTLRETRNA